MGLALVENHVGWLSLQVAALGRRLALLFTALQGFTAAGEGSLPPGNVKLDANGNGYDTTYIAEYSNHGHGLGTGSLLTLS
jgi:hypothetical protein